MRARRPREQALECKKARSIAHFFSTQELLGSCTQVGDGLPDLPPIDKIYCTIDRKYWTTRVRPPNFFDMKHHAELESEWRTARVTRDFRVCSPCRVLDFRVWLQSRQTSRQDADENFGLASVCRVAFRRLFGHCFGGLPAPCGNLLFCFGYTARGLRFPSKSFLQEPEKICRDPP